MDRRRLLTLMGIGAALPRVAASGHPSPLAETLARLVHVDWERHALMTKNPGVEPPWRLRLESEHRAAVAGRRPCRN